MNDDNDMQDTSPFPGVHAFRFHIKGVYSMVKGFRAQEDWCSVILNSVGKLKGLRIPDNQVGDVHIRM